MSVLTEIFRENRFRSQDVPPFEAKLFYEGARRRPYMVRFFVLLFLSTVIATFGVLNDSTATVIGAMIIAPLMTPIMAAAAALVMGQHERTVQSLLLVAGGVVLVVGFATLIALLESRYTPINFTDNTQIAGRISPQLSDLLVALASGAAGAFAMARDDVADSLPGVAIAISLVPPLCVVGIGIGEGNWDAAWGAFILFSTNFLSILLAGGAFLAILGLERAANIDMESLRRRRAFMIIILGVLLVSIPLVGTTLRVTRETLTEYRTTITADEWVQGSDYELRSVQVHGNEARVLIVGEGPTPTLADLEAALTERYRRPVTVRLQIVAIDDELLEIVPPDD